MSDQTKEILQDLISEEAQRRESAPPPRIPRRAKSSKLLTAVMAAVATITFSAALLTTLSTYQANRGPSAIPPKSISLEELGEFMPVASFHADGNHLRVRVTDDWIRQPKDERDTQFTALCYTISNRYYHTASVEDLQGNVLARWNGGMIELLR